LGIPTEDIKQETLFGQREKPEYNTELFEKLRTLRKELSDKRNVPPYIIFSDVALQEMAIYFPRNNAEFLKIKGVGQQKLNDFG
jgi:ATP-dependent DNA helicase RecQ